MRLRPPRDARPLPGVRYDPGLTQVDDMPDPLDYESERRARCRKVDGDLWGVAFLVFGTVALYAIGTWLYLILP
jgi:hypothetical protein